MKSFPTLYKQTNTGKIQQWNVAQIGDSVNSTYGQVHGKLQTTIDIIKTGKNIGKSNETSIEQQASLKAQQLFDKKVKEGYVENIEDAAETKNALEAIELMLAFAIEKKEKYATFPAIAQPKLDGLRCIAIIVEGKARLFSRTQKEYLTLPHIVKELEELFEGKTIDLDGELYNHELKDDFEAICSYIKRDDVHDKHELIQYHVYDVPNAGGVLSHPERFGLFKDVVRYTPVPASFIKIVETTTICEKEDIEPLHDFYLSEGYEGLMLRHPTMPYEFKRSASLLKVKVMQDAEFEIIGVEEGTGKLMGSAGSIWVKDKEGKEFKAKMKSYHNAAGKRIESKEDYQARCIDWFINIDKYIGKDLTIQFQKFSKYGVPIFPIAIRTRGEE